MAKFNSLASNERKYLCVVCSRKFKRTRDLQIHIQIMHKNLSELQKQQIQLEIQKTNQMLKTRYLNNIKQQQQQQQQNQQQQQQQQFNVNTIMQVSGIQQLNLQNQIIQQQQQQQQQHQQQSVLSLPNNEKVCLICKKSFKNSTGASFNKSFIRHMQIQHGLNEKGERLIECPVCEKCFFKRQQLERHMHTHEVWVEFDANAASNSSAHDSKIVKKNNKFMSMPDYRDRHSILYCQVFDTRIVVGKEAVGS